MARLKDLEFRAFYRSGEDDLQGDFYRPALAACTHCDLFTGTITAASISDLAAGLREFLTHPGVIRLAVTARAIRETAHDREVAELICGMIDQAAGQDPESVSTLAALLESGKLELRIAVPIGTDGGPVAGEKFGLFGDSLEDRIAFTGTADDTADPSRGHSESLAVYRRQVEAETERIRYLRKRFQSYWENTSGTVRTLPLPDAVRARLADLAPEDLKAFLRQAGDRQFSDLRDYQVRAVHAWMDAGYRGIWSMATGTGKTPIAIRAIAARIREKGCVVILVPTQDLVVQWKKSIERMKVPASVVCCFSEDPGWRKAAARAVLQRHLRAEERRPAYLIATASTGISEDFKNVLKTIPAEELLIVGDEVHRLGSRAWSRIFQVVAGLGRLGLSATPARQWDQAGTRQIFDYFGGIVFEYGLQDALRDRWLCPYRYEIKLVGMEAGERAVYRELSRKISTLAAQLAHTYGLAEINLQEILRRAREDGNMQLELLLYARADVVKGAAGKRAILEQLAANPSVNSCMVYCDDEQQVGEALSVLSVQNRRAVGFTSARLDGEDRAAILRDFSTGLYEFIVAIRCLDEGIDIPDVRNALIMASSKTEREWIQRRGRLLRNAPGKDHAVIYDCIVIPSRVDDDEKILDPISEIEIAILQGELARAREFARPAMNSADAILKIESIRTEAQRSIVRHPASDQEPR
jgi:superfamily II DNA or RNA helicase